MNAVPTKIGKYEIVREIAQSVDIVYEGFDPLINRRVAVKVLNLAPGTSTDERNTREGRFLREARAAGGLNHPNLVTVFESGQDAGLPFIAMELLTGRSLRKEIERSGQFDEVRAIDTSIEVLKGLAFAHGKGVIHRDIKPDNVHVLEDGTIKITDFGIAKVTYESNLTVAGQVWGTLGYAPPEQLKGMPVDARSDLFSVGALLYMLCSGSRPFEGADQVAIAHATCNVDPIRPAHMSTATWAIVQKALSKAPEGRFQSADDMIPALRQARKTIKSRLSQSSSAKPVRPVVAANRLPQINQNASAQPVAAQAPVPQKQLAPIQQAAPRVAVSPQRAAQPVRALSVSQAGSQVPWKAIVGVAVSGYLLFVAIQCMSRMATYRPTQGFTQTAPTTTSGSPSSTTASDKSNPDSRTDDQSMPGNGEQITEPGKNEIIIKDPSRARVVPDSNSESEPPRNSRVLRFGNDDPH